MKMRFSVDIYRPNYLEGLAALYNRETAIERHIAPLTAERFNALVAAKSYFDPAGLFVALETGSVVGWVHACVAPGSESRHNPQTSVPRIRLLVFPRERPDVGRGLVAEATSWLRKSGQGEILAMHSKAGYPFYRCLWLGAEPKCPATMPHVQAALGAAGYANTLESVFMTRDMAEWPAGPRPPPMLELAESPTAMVHQPMRESWAGFEPRVVRAFLAGREVGRVGWVVEPYHADRLGAPCVNVWSMNVMEAHRRKGIATAMVSHMLQLGYDRGARHASANTQLWNTAAQATYAKLGLMPTGMTIGRTLHVG